jgi:thiosulfate/3-mercaptopyruvate sulfurtransferase
MLVSAEELDRHRADPDWVIFDCRHDLTDFARGARLYRESHIPGAHFAAVEEDLSGKKTGANGRHPLSPPEAFAGFLAAHGVTRDSTIVAYDDAGGLYAARLWWMARWIGLSRVFLLNGGFQKWVEEHRPLTAEIPEKRSAALAVDVKEGWVWSTTDVLARLNDTKVGLVDARTAERYRGETEPIDAFAGHIPGAMNRFYKLNLGPDLTFRPRDQVRREFLELLGDRRPENVVHYCGSGVTACANLFAMEYAGLPGSKLYAGSWSEWLADPARPTEPKRK